MDEAHPLRYGPDLTEIVPIAVPEVADGPITISGALSPWASATSGLVAPWSTKDGPTHSGSIRSGTDQLRDAPDAGSFVTSGGFAGPGPPRRHVNQSPHWAMPNSLGARNSLARLF